MGDKIERQVKMGDSSIYIENQQINSIHTGFTPEENRKLLNEAEARFYGNLLDQIEQELKDYNPQRALSNVEKIITSIEKERNLNTTLIARLKYLRGCCRYESGIQNEWIFDFLFAYDIEPENRYYQEKALIARMWQGNYEKAEKLADDIINEREKNNIVAWGVKYALNEDVEVPELVLYTEGGIKFKSIAGDFCKRVQNFKKLKSLFLNDFYKWDKPNITFENKGYWFILANLRLGEIIDTNPILIFNQVIPEIQNHPDLPATVTFLSDILAYFEETEKSKYLITYRYLLAYGQYLLEPNIENVAILLGIFKKLDSQVKKQFLFLTTCCFLQTQQFDEAIEFINMQTDLRPDYHYLKAYAYLQKKCFTEAEQSAKTYFDLVNVFGADTLGHFVFFLNSIVQELSKKEKYFNDYLKAAKFSSEFFRKIAEFFTYFDSRPKEEIIGLANHIVLMEDIKEFEDFYFMICEILRKIGQFEESNRILEPKVDFINCVKGYDLYIVNLHSMESNSVQLLELLENRRKKNTDVVHMEFIYMELELLKLIPDFAQILDVVELGLECEPNNGELILHKIQALSELNKKSELQIFLKEKRSVFHAFSLKYICSYLCPFAIEAKDYKLMVELLYPLALVHENTEAREAYVQYLTVLAKDNISFRMLDKVVLDSFVEIEISGKKKLFRVNETAVKNDKFVQFLVENELNTSQVFEFGRYSFENNNPCKVVKVYDLREGLLKEIMDEIGDNVNPSSIFESVKIEGEPNLENLEKILVKKFGKQGDEIKNIQKDLLEKYKKRETSFNDLLQFNNNNPLITYYELIARDGVKILPLPFFGNITFHDETTVVLDFTTIPLFFELSKQINLVFNRKFIVSYFLVARYQQILAEMKREKGESLRLGITTEGIMPNIIPVEAIQKNIQFVEDLLNWIIGNCEIHLVREKLDSLRTSKIRAKNKDNIQFHYLTDTLFLSIRSNHILVSDDSIFSKGYISLLNNQNLLSSEAFLRGSFQDKYEPQILEYLLKFNYVGLSFDYSRVRIELMKYLNREENLYEKCLSNLSPMKTMNVPMLLDSTLLARIIYIHAADCQKKKQETQKLFDAVLEGVVKDNVIVAGFLFQLHNQFSLFSIEWIDSVKEDFLIAFNRS